MKYYPQDIVKTLIDDKSDFAKLINVYDNIKQQNGLILCATYQQVCETIKQVIDHCKH